MTRARKFLLPHPCYLIFSHNLEREAGTMTGSLPQLTAWNYCGLFFKRRVQFFFQTQMRVEDKGWTEIDRLMWHDRSLPDYGDLKWIMVVCFGQEFNEYAF